MIEEEIKNYMDILLSKQQTQSVKKNSMFGARGIEIIVVGTVDRLEVMKQLNEKFPKWKFNLTIYKN